jgi:hypothetical protein
MPTSKRFVLGWFAAFLAGVAVAQTVAEVTANTLAPGDGPEIAIERGAEGRVVLRPSVSGKNYAVLIEPGRMPSRSEITFHQGSLALDLRNGARARIYELRRVMECVTDCKPCQPGPADTCIVPPVPVGPPPPGGAYRVGFLSARP